MTENAALVLIVGLFIVLFWGEPDMQDAIISYLYSHGE